MKEKLKFLANIIMLAIIDVIILLNFKVIYEKGLQIDILENIVLIVLSTILGIVILKDAYKAGKRILLNQRLSEIVEEDYGYEDFGDEEYNDR